MVHELHKAGYQRIRISPAMAPNGIHWRCAITFAGNVAADGYSVVDGSNGQAALYTSGQGARYFNWQGAETMTARMLAVRFLKAFPNIAARGAGRDWAYAGWLTGCSDAPSTVGSSISAPIIRSTKRSSNDGGRRPSPVNRRRGRAEPEGTAKFTRHSSTNPHIPRQAQLRR